MSRRARLIRARAPLRISFAGGGTDVPPFNEEEGSCVLNGTLNKYAYGTLRALRGARIKVRSLDLGLSLTLGPRDRLVYDGKMDLVKAAIRKMLGRRRGGMEIFLHTEAPPGSGLGASSAMVVTLVGLLKEHLRRSMTDYEIAETAFHIEREDLEIQGGFQDQYAAAFGGFNFLEYRSGRVVVNPLRVSDDVINELEHNLLLCYTGSTRLSSHIIEDQVRRNRRRALRRIKDLAVEMKEALLRRRLDEFARLMHEEWMAKRSLSPRITTKRIDALYAAARRAGARGGKITGAGGGGYMLLYCEFDRKHRVAEAVRRSGGTVEGVTFSRRGLETWHA